MVKLLYKLTIVEMWKLKKTKFQIEIITKSQ